MLGDMEDCPRELKKTVSIENNDDNTEDYWKLCAMQFASSAMVPMVMQAVMDLKVLEIISKAGAEGVSAKEIASQLELTDDATITTASSMLDRMLCLLSAHSMLTCTLTTTNDPDDDQMTTKRRLYTLAPIAKYFIPNSDGVSFGPFMSLYHENCSTELWRELKPAVLKGGIPWKRLYGMHVFDYAETNQRFKEAFHETMTNNTTIVINEILKSYKGFDQLHRLVDIGGGHGVALKLITSKYPHVKGINFDQPHVIQHAPVYPGVEHVAGNMFESVPGGDAIFMKWILHDWSDDHCLKLLRNCHRVLPSGGKVIVVDGIVPLVPETTPAAKEISQFDVLMMSTVGGKERTRQQFLSLATNAGFAGIRFKFSVCNLWVMEFYK